MLRTLSLALMALSGLPLFCMALGRPGMSLSVSVATWN
jgi:hypothetical protein